VGLKVSLEVRGSTLWAAVGPREVDFRLQAPTRANQRRRRSGTRFAQWHQTPTMARNASNSVRDAEVRRDRAGQSQCPAAIHRRTLCSMALPSSASSPRVNARRLKWWAAAAAFLALIGFVLFLVIRQDNPVENSPHQFNLSFEGNGERGPGTIKIDTSSDSLCLSLSVPRFKRALAAHVHNDRSGPLFDVVVVKVLEPPDRFKNQMCVDVPEHELSQIVSDPSDYYVDLHEDDEGRVSSWSVLTPTDDSNG